MSLWDNVKKFAQPYSDDDYDDYDEEEDDYADDFEPEEKPVRRSNRRAPAPAPAPVAEKEEEDFFGSAPVVSTPSATGFSGTILNSSTPSVSRKDRQDVVLFRPGSFNDTTKAANDLKENKAVIVNMENVDKALARRVVDFLSGCVYALEGDVKKIAQSAYLFCPHNMNIVGDLETLQAEIESYI